MADGTSLIERPCSDVIIAPAPFTPRVERVAAREGQTIAQILLDACRQGLLDPQDLARTEVFVDGVRLEDRAAALDFVPLAGQVVNIAVMVQGGHGGAKGIETILQVALMIGAFWITGPAGPLAGGLANLGITGLASVGLRLAAAAAIELGGAALLNSIFPTPSPPGQIYSLNDQSNQARVRAAMPLVLGQRRVAFDVASTAYSTIIGNDTWITVMYGVHYGPCTVTDIGLSGH